MQMCVLTSKRRLLRRFLRVRLYASRPWTLASMRISSTSQNWQSVAKRAGLRLTNTQLRPVAYLRYNTEEAGYLPSFPDLPPALALNSGVDEGIALMWSSESFASMLQSSASLREMRCGSFCGEWYRRVPRGSCRGDFAFRYRCGGRLDM